jgi:hypothetical protein
VIDGEKGERDREGGGREVAERERERDYSIRK